MGKLNEGDLYGFVDALWQLVQSLRNLMSGACMRVAAEQSVPVVGAKAGRVCAEQD